MKPGHLFVALLCIIPLSHGLFLKHIVNGIRYKTAKLEQLLDWITEELELDQLEVEQVEQRSNDVAVVTVGAVVTTRTTTPSPSTTVTTTTTRKSTTTTPRTTTSVRTSRRPSQSTTTTRTVLRRGPSRQLGKRLCRTVDKRVRI